MFLLFGYVSIALVQLYRQYRRRSRYSQTMLRALRQGSVLVQRGKSVKHGSVGALLNSPLLTCSRSYKETQLMAEDGLAISVVVPRQRVDLAEWTSYLDVHPGQDANNSVIVLLEAGRPDDLAGFVRDAIKVPLAQQVHVLQHGCPIAWKSGCPFGILLLCTYQNFVLLCDAFGQGRLTLDEDLELYRLLTVSATGRPQSLKRKSQEVGQIPRVAVAEDESSKAVPNNISVSSATTDDAKKANSVSMEKENIPAVRTLLAASPKVVADGAAGEAVRVDAKVMAPLSVDCSGGGVAGGTDKRSDDLLQDGGKLPQNLCIGATNQSEDLVLNGTDTEQKKDTVTTPGKTHTPSKSETFSHLQSQDRIAEEKNGHASEAPNGDFSSPQSVSKADSSQPQKEAEINGAGNSVNSDGPKSPASKDSDKGFLQKRGSTKTGKPPNVLVYCGLKDSARKFNNIKSCLEQCLNLDAYTLYHLSHEQVTSTPWADNSAALIISCDKLYTDVEKIFTDYLVSGGRVFSFGSSIETNFLERKEVQARPAVTKFGFSKWKDVSAIQGCHRYTRGSLKQGNSSMEAVVVDRKSGEPLVVLLTLSGPSGNGSAVFSQLLLERDPAEMAVDSKTFSQLKQSNSDRLAVMGHLLSLLDLDTSPTPAHQLTPCYLLTQNQALKDSLLAALADRMKQGTIKSRSISLHFVKDGSKVSPASSEVLPVLTNPDGMKVEFFEPEAYWQYLTTSVLGRLVFYTDVIPTTMTVFEGIQFSIPDDVGVIAVAGRQTSGKGRGGNAWLSPVGCAMFTLPLSIPLDSNLGHRSTFLQHIVSLGVVHGIRSLPGYQDVELRVKWPNDIYYKDQMKLGGVLVTSTVLGDRVHATIGCGVNVSNSHPTICVNDIIQQHNSETSSNLSPLSSSQVVALTVSTIENLVAQFQSEGVGSFCELYYKYWLHSGACVQLESENQEVTICGLDDYGFLRVVTKQGRELSVQPDGNTFDMMRNLIALKRQ